MPRSSLAAALLSLTTACATLDPVPSPELSTCDVEFMILGIGQDGGAPQIDRHTDSAWADPDQRLFAASGVLMDHRDGSRFLFEATPDIREQLYLLEQEAGPAKADMPIGLSGVFLTHAHIGHYAGLMFAGHESAGAKGLPVYAMPRMAEYLSANGPWDQMVRYDNIDIKPLQDGDAVRFDDRLTVTPHRVPHRDEYSETVGYVVKGPSRSVLFLPDIDDWDRWETEHGKRIENMIAMVDVAYLDATFFDNNELPGRDMSAFPHPRLSDSINRFSTLSVSEQRKVRFFHLNHTNPARRADSEARQTVDKMGFRIAERGERVCLD